jgi:hypothetical protein
LAREFCADTFFSQLIGPLVFPSATTPAHFSIARDGQIAHDMMWNPGNRHGYRRGSSALHVDHHHHREESRFTQASRDACLNVRSQHAYVPMVRCVLQVMRRIVAGFAALRAPCDFWTAYRKSLITYGPCDAVMWPALTGTQGKCHLRLCL